MAEEIKLLFIISSLDGVGGISKTTFAKINYLAEEGYDVHILTYDKRGGNPFHKISSKVKIHHLNLDVNEKDFIFTYRDLLTKCLYQEKFSHVFTVLAKNDFYFLPKIKDGSLKIAEYHTNYRAIRGFSTYRKNLKKYINEKISFYRFINIAKKYDKFIVLTDEDKSFFSKYIANVDVIANPITTNSNQKRPDKKNNKAVAIGRLVGVKNHIELIEIWNIVNNYNQNYVLEIYGSGMLKDELNNKIKSLNLTDHVKLMGTHKNIQGILPEYDLHLLTSKFEGLPNVILEAMDSGIPTIAYDCGGGPSFLIKNNCNGILVKPSERDRFAKAIIELMEDDNLRNQYGHQAYIDSKEFSLEKIMNKWVEIINKK